MPAIGVFHRCIRTESCAWRRGLAEVLTSLDGRSGRFGPFRERELHFWAVPAGLRERFQGLAAEARRLPLRMNERTTSTSGAMPRRRLQEHRGAVIITPTRVVNMTRRIEGEAMNLGESRGESGVRGVPAAPAHSSTRPGESPLAGRRILLVEDEDVLAQVLALELKELGAEVECAGLLADAACAFSVRGPWDALLLDRRLPDGDGLQLLPTVMETKPRPGVVLTTGYPLESERSVELQSEGVVVLHKTKTNRAMASALRVAMARANELSSRESGEWTVSRRTKSTRLGRAEQIAWDMLLEAQRTGGVVSVEALVVRALRRLPENSGNPDSAHHLIRRLRIKLSPHGVVIHSEPGEGYWLEGQNSSGEFRVGEGDSGLPSGSSVRRHPRKI